MGAGLTPVDITAAPYPPFKQGKKQTPASPSLRLLFNQRKKLKTPFETDRFEMYAIVRVLPSLLWFLIHAVKFFICILHRLQGLSVLELIQGLWLISRTKVGTYKQTNQCLQLNMHCRSFFLQRLLLGIPQRIKNSW